MTAWSLLGLSAFCGMFAWYCACEADGCKSFLMGFYKVQTVALSAVSLACLVLAICRIAA